MQEAAAAGFGLAKESGFWDTTKAFLKHDVEEFCKGLDNVCLPVCSQLSRFDLMIDTFTGPVESHHVKRDLGFLVFVNAGGRIKLPPEIGDVPVVKDKRWEYQTAWLLLETFEMAAVPEALRVSCNKLIHLSRKITGCTNQASISMTRTTMAGISSVSPSARLTMPFIR